MLEGSHSKSLSFNYAVWWEDAGMQRSLFTPLRPDRLGSAAILLRNIRDIAIWVKLGKVRNGFDFSKQQLQQPESAVCRRNLMGIGSQSSIRKQSTPSSTSLML